MLYRKASPPARVEQNTTSPSLSVKQKQSINGTMLQCGVVGGKRHSDSNLNTITEAVSAWDSLWHDAGL